MPNTMKSRSLSKRRMRSLRRHCSSKNHRRALRSRSMRTRKIHRKLCKRVRRKSMRRKSMRRKTARKTKRKIKRKRRRHRGGDGTTNYSNGMGALSPQELALNAGF